MASARDIKRRIKGVKATGKITRAMEMISAVKMRKAVAAVTNIRPYAHSVIAVLHQLTAIEKEAEHPLLSERPVAKELYVVIGSNRGLCGSFNSQIARKLKEVRDEDKDREAEYITLGKKADSTVRRLGGAIVASFPDILAAPSILETRVIADMIIGRFRAGTVDRVVMVYTDFVSTLIQRVKVRALLPVTEKDVLKALNEMNGAGADVAHPAHPDAEYIIEPAPFAVFEKMIPQLVAMELYHAILESNASQEAARMMAMKNATDAARDMANDLTLAFNQIRQQKITQEIAELSAGMAAVSH